MADDLVRKGFSSCLCVPGTVIDSSLAELLPDIANGIEIFGFKARI